MAAFALRDDGWYLRMDNIWAKGVSGQKELTQQLREALRKAGLTVDQLTRTMAHLEPYVGNCMPESVKDRSTRSHEYMFLLTKGPKYYYDGFAVQEQGVFPAGTRAAKGSQQRVDAYGVNARPPEYAVYSGTRNRRSVWVVPTRPFKGAHFAVFPPSLVETPLLASTPAYGCCAACGAPYNRIVEKPTVARSLGWTPACTCDAGVVPSLVLDPFGGSGTVAAVAELYGRRAISIELNPVYAGLRELRQKDVQRALRRDLGGPAVAVPEREDGRESYERGCAEIPDVVA